MKLCVKRIHCDNCRRLVKGREQTAEGSTRVHCPRCDSLLRVWNGVAWKYPAKNTQ